VNVASQNVEDKRLAHIVLQTGQSTVLRDWYLKVLDAHVVFENEMSSFMTFDEEHHRLAIAQLPQPAPRTSMTVGLAHSAYTFGSLHGLLGPSFDPDAMLAGLRAGTSESELITRAWASAIFNIPRSARRGCAAPGCANPL
jgi:hypothetical protein